MAVPFIITFSYRSKSTLVCRYSHTRLLWELMPSPMKVAYIGYVKIHISLYIYVIGHRPWYLTLYNVQVYNLRAYAWNEFSISNSCTFASNMYAQITDKMTCLSRSYLEYWSKIKISCIMGQKVSLSTRLQPFDFVMMFSTCENTIYAHLCNVGYI